MNSRRQASYLHRGSLVALDQPATEMGDWLLLPCEPTPSSQPRANSLLDPGAREAILFDDGPVDLELVSEKLVEGGHRHRGRGIEPPHRCRHALGSGWCDEEIVNVVGLKTEHEIRQNRHPSHAIPLVVGQVRQ